MLSPDFANVALGVIGIAAVISPICTAIISNRHAEKMKQLEYEHEDKAEREAHEREIYEGFIRSAGACLVHPTIVNLQAYNSQAELLIHYVPNDIRVNIKSLSKELNDRDEHIGDMSTLTTIAIQLQELRKQSL